MIGIIIRVSRVDISRLLIMVMVIGVCILVFLFIVMVSGRKLNNVYSVVMMIGCRCEWVFLIRVFCLGMLVLCSWLILLIRMIVFLVIRFISRMRLMNIIIEIGLLVSISVRIVLISVSGMVNRMINGCSSDLNCEVIIR